MLYSISEKEICDWTETLNSCFNVILSVMQNHIVSSGFL